MSVTSLHKETGRWLTSYGDDAVPGSEHTTSVGHPLYGGQFTTYRLGDVVAHDAYGRPLFDMNDALVCLDKGVVWEDKTCDWARLGDVRDAVADAKQRYPMVVRVADREFAYHGMDQWRPAAPHVTTR